MLFKSQCRFLRPDGKTLWIEVQGHASYDAQGTPIEFFGTSVDITERKTALLSLATERRKLEDIFAKSTAGMSLMEGPHFIFEKVNSTWKELVGPRSYTGKSWTEAYREPGETSFFIHLKEVYETGIPLHVSEAVVTVKIFPGVLEKRHHDLSYFRIVDCEGKPYGIFCQASDVTKFIKDKNLLKKLSNPAIIF